MRREKQTRPKGWHLLISLVILLSVETSALSAVRLVPSRDYRTIQSAIDKANIIGDEIVVAPGTYTGSGNRDLDFKGKAITVRSQINPANPDWNIIAATIIDCGGNADAPHRAFWFHTHEGSNSKVLGFTIRNGYARGLRGVDGSFAADPPVPYQSVNPTDPNGTPRAENGTASPNSNGYGGGILCGDPCNPSAFASPTIKYCVITNCTVAGGQGGRGATGQSGPWSYQPPDPNAARVTVNDGQWGGIGGAGSGNGYGGGIACLSGSSPSISDCTIKDNFARGGRGGDGGNGGNAVSSPANASPPNYNGGNGSFGGSAGNSKGDGIGGGIYCVNSSSPSIVNCTFSNNIATTGARAAGGVAGQGTAIPAPIGPATNGADGSVSSTGGIAGGAAYYSSNPLNAHPSDANFTNCTFTGNSAYTVGGALYSDKSNKVTLNTCDFVNNMGGAVYCGSGSTLNINNNAYPSHKCLFTGNYAPNGGAVYIGPAGSANIQNCIFGGNSADGDGGALKSESGIALQNCSFGGNTAQNGYGGAADVYTFNSPTPLTINANNCSFSGNQSMFGGGFSSENFNATFSSCYFIGNTAERSGGLDLVIGDVNITGSVVKDNVATGGNGGGLNCQYITTQAKISNSTFTGNLASGFSPSGGGGAIYFDGWAPTHRVFNCLMTGNSATVDGGAIYSYNATPEIKNCTFDDDFAGGFGGAIFSGWNSLPQITNCIFRECDSHAIHEENGGDAHATYCLFYDNYNGDYYDSVNGLYTGPTGPHSVGNIPNGSNNLYGNPLFVSGDLGGYYLSPASLAVDSGSGTALSLGLNTYTTRTDNVGDAGQVDRGYHYYKSANVGIFKLTAGVVGGHGTVAPTSPQPIDYNSVSNTYRYYAGTIVTLTATSNTGWLVKAWTGTDNDSTTKSTSTVVMYADRTVAVEFRQPRTLIVSAGGGQQGYYPDIQSAVIDADNGDTVVVYAGTYYGLQSGYVLTVDRSVIITSRNPDDPCCVAATIIDGLAATNPWSNWGILFTYNSTGAVLNGFTIQNCGGFIDRVGRNGDRGASPPHPDGYDGISGQGSAIYVQQGAGPTIKNCVIRNNQIIGGLGGNGVGATTTQNAGRGGWGGWVHGGAIYCAPDSSPRFINCRITNNNAIGGNGGNGGNGAYPGGFANYGGNWSRDGSPGSPALDYDPLSLTITPITSGSLWEVWQWDYSIYYWPMYGKPLGTSYIGDYRWYSGYGGGAYCDVNSSVTFIDCQISGNLAQGGMSGQGGLQAPSLRPTDPLVPYEIPSFGGGAYCAAGATVTFTGCTIANNISSPPVPVRFRLDPYLGHGGGVCAEDTANVVFNNCTFSENEASVGGGFNWANANPAISDCNFTFNTAFQGGGLFGQHGLGTIIGCNITNNTAVSDPNVEGELLGAGGGIHCWATDVNIIDCNISSNQAETSGGGVYFGGENYSSLINCLITDNTARRDGGGVSANIYSDVNIVSCTIANNIVGGQGYGGGLYSYYYSYVDVIDSIIWGNVGATGSQLALGTGFAYDPIPSTADVSYSVIGPPRNVNAIIEPAEALAITVTNDASVLANAILGPGIELVGQPQYTGADTAAGTFVGGLAAGIGIESGIILTSGNANNALPPNKSDGITASNNLPGDPDLNVLLQARGANAAITNDAAILEVTFTTRGGSLFFNFVFASDEYNEYTNSSFNDVFGFFLDGRNIALIPGTTTPVAINNVNGGNPLGINASNSQFFHNNDISDGGPFFDIEYDGFTSVFTAQALNVGSGTHTIRLAIADTNDYVLDSAVFIEAGSFSDKPSYSDPIYVDKGCTLIGWNPNAPDPNNPWMPATHNLRIDADPLFVEGYFLSQIAAGQSVNSKCVDAGHTDASTAGMYRHTTRTDLVVEDPNSLVDLGYHYLRTTEFVGDLNYDGMVDFADMLILVLNWLDQCDFPDWCHGADLNRDGIVNNEDYAIMAKDIEDGLKETTPPVPNPMTWEATPTSMPAATWAKMTAAKAKDAHGGTIQYYFQRTNASGVPDGFYRNWDPNRTFTNTGLTLNQTYGYRVKARDARHNETGWSVIGLVTVGKESPPSAPTNLAATAVSQTRINLTWTDTSNETGFKIERRTGAGSFTQIADTFAANVNTYSDTGLTAGTTYTYRVIAYNTGGDSPYSNVASATTQSGGGGGPSGEPNQPIMIASNIDPNCTQTKEIDLNTGKTYWYHTVVATVSDIGGGQPVWFRFVCNSQSVFSSPWISSAGTFPMYLQHPVSSVYPMVVVNVNGTTVTYRIMVKQGGASGYGMSWKVCASFNADGSNSSCSANLTIPWH